MLKIFIRFLLVVNILLNKDNFIYLKKNNKPELLEEITNEEHVNFFAKMLNKSNENKLNSKTNRLLKIIYESVVQETFDFVGVMLLLDKVFAKKIIYLK